MSICLEAGVIGYLVGLDLDFAMDPRIPIQVLIRKSIPLAKKDIFSLLTPCRSNCTSSVSVPP